MKNILLLFMVIAAMVIFSSCAKEDLENQKIDDSQIEIALDEAFQAVLMDDIIKSVDSYSGFGEGMLKSAVVIDDKCPVVTVKKIDEDKNWPRKVIIDYGEGCEINGKIKSGRIIIEKTAPWKTPGSVREVKFKDYVVGEGEDAIAFTGHKRIENITKEDGIPTFTIDVNVELTSSKNEVEKIVKRKAQKTQVWKSGFADREITNEYKISGESRIVVTKGEMEKVIEKKLNEILIVQGCKFPQGGVAEFDVKTFDDKKLSFGLDYSYSLTEDIKEECDNWATLLMNEDSKDLDLSARWWKEVRK